MKIVFIVLGVIWCAFSIVVGLTFMVYNWQSNIEFAASFWIGWKAFSSMFLSGFTLIALAIIKEVFDKVTKQEK